MVALHGNVTWIDRTFRFLYTDVKKGTLESHLDYGITIHDGYRSVEQFEGTEHPLSRIKISCKGQITTLFFNTSGEIQKFIGYTGDDEALFNPVTARIGFIKISDFDSKGLAISDWLAVFRRGYYIPIPVLLSILDNRGHIETIGKEVGKKFLALNPIKKSENRY